MPPVEILISAGEASGDMYAARLAAALRARADVHLFGMGGPRMREAGVEIVVDSAEVGVVGVFEVFRKLPALFRAKRRLLDAVDRRRPALAILTDFPGFHLRLARWLNGRGVRPVYFVLPQFWAWRPWRANLVRRRFSRGLCIFPFEVEFYRKAGVQVDWIGHPLVDQVHPTTTRAEFISKHGLDPARPIIAILPGSRPGELANHMALLRESAAQIHAAMQTAANSQALPQFIVAAAPGLTPAHLAAHLPGANSHDEAGRQNEAAAPGDAEDRGKIGQSDARDRGETGAGSQDDAGRQNEADQGDADGRGKTAGRSRTGRGTGALGEAGRSEAGGRGEANARGETGPEGRGEAGGRGFSRDITAQSKEGALAPEATSHEPRFHIVEDETYDALAAADLAIVSSGTATVETALIGTPMIVVYRVSPASAWVARRLVRTPYFAMVNLIANRRIVPELFQEDFSPQRVAAEATRILTSPEASDEMRRELAIVRERLGPPGAIDRAAALIAGLIAGTARR